MFHALPMLGTVESDITAALTAGGVTATAFLGVAIAIPIAFLVFKLGKRVLGRV